VAGWGYCLYSRPHPRSPGFSRVLVAIRKAPTEAHFDPEVIELRLHEMDGTTSRTALGLKPPFQDVRHFCPGEVIVRDRVNKHVSFFGFGGSVQAVTRRGETVYSLSSPAPILEMTRCLADIPEHLACEAEAIIKRAEAKWAPDLEDFEKRLAQMDPLVCYVSAVRSVLMQHRGSTKLRRGSPQFYSDLQRERTWLTKVGHWAITPLTLEGLLAPD